MPMETIVITRKTETVTTRIEDEVIVLDLEGEEYFGLEGAARALWEYLEGGPSSFDEIVMQWIKSFDNSQEDIHELLQETIAQLERSGLIVVERQIK